MRWGLLAQLLRRAEFLLTVRGLLHNLAKLGVSADACQQWVGLQCLARAVISGNGLAQKSECNLLFAAKCQQRTLVILQFGILLG